MIEALSKAAESLSHKEGVEKSALEKGPLKLPDEISKTPTPDFKPPWKIDPEKSEKVEVRQDQTPPWKIEQVPQENDTPPWKQEPPTTELKNTNVSEKAELNPDQITQRNSFVNFSETDDSEYQSTYEQRLQHTPNEDGKRGQWDGERGESKYIPTDPEIKEILKKYGLDGIEYKDGIPDFSKVSESTVEIDNMTDNRKSNFEQCDEKCAEKWNKEGRDGKNDWTARDVANWRRENGYSWHERNDMKTCDLVPTKVNVYFGHLGGVGEYKISKSKDGGFDE